jgi:hypothetical protein
MGPPQLKVLLAGVKFFAGERAAPPPKKNITQSSRIPQLSRADVSP